MMNYFNPTIRNFVIITLFIFTSFLSDAQSSKTLWKNHLEDAIKTGDTAIIKSFFSDDFGKEEIESWKYELKRGYLNFTESRIIPLDSNDVLLHIPTNETSYDGENHDAYFDFIYRIYKTLKSNGKYVLSKRAMDKYKPDFRDYNLKIDVDTKNQIFLFDCNISVDTKSTHLLLKLAKDFEISDFRINGKKSLYEKLGYFLYCITDTIGIQHIDINGRLKSPQTNNQFISMNNKSFFIRLGGFAAVPSPPPGNNGRYFFSDDSTHFKIVYNYPQEYTLLHYGDSSMTILLNNQKQTKTIINGQWMDNVVFYAQNNWEKKEIVRSNTHIGFYFNKEDEKERDYIIAEVDTLIQWINKKFNNYGNFKINFVVLDNFVEGGLLNDSRSIVAQNAEIIGSGGIGYLHEICHSAPQPIVKGNYLWIKEGFTNYLSFQYLFSQKANEFLWKDLKRKYLHYFDLYEEPLINIRSTSVPTYWAAYSKASWVYRMLETEMGENNFREALYKLGTMENIELNNNRAYLEIFEQESGGNFTEFEEQWLYRKKNPVLSVNGQLEKNGDNSLVKINISQKEPYFTLPLEVEIKTNSNTYRETIPVKGKETTFKMQVKGETVSITYDPDSRLFAIIKDHRKSFVQSFTIPKDTATYISEDSNRIFQLWYTATKNRIYITKKDKKNVSVLELTNKLSPVSYIINRDTVFIQDIKAKTIEFKNNTYDIAEAVYPKEFIPFLFSIADWKDIKQLSMLYHIPESLHCHVIRGELENISEGGITFSLKKLLVDEKEIILCRDGFPVSFKMLDGKIAKRE
jgi:hypothetical protein